MCISLVSLYTCTVCICICVCRYARCVRFWVVCMLTRRWILCVCEFVFVIYMHSMYMYMYVRIYQMCSFLGCVHAQTCVDNMRTHGALVFRLRTYIHACMFITYKQSMCMCFVLVYRVLRAYALRSRRGIIWKQTIELRMYHTFYPRMYRHSP